MSRISGRILLVTLLALIALIGGAKVRYSGKAPVKLPAASCDARLWDHVYRPERLRVLETCTAVEGRVVSVQRQSDGDLHIALDPDHKSVLNLFNLVHGRGHLVVEVICDHAPAPAHQDAIAACAGFTSQVILPGVTDRIRVTGFYVTDRENGWNEIHPVTRIEILAAH